MVSLKGITIAIVSKGKDLPEYPDPDAPVPGDRTAIVYVEAKPGTRFKIRCTASSDIPRYGKFDGLNYVTFIDGVKVDVICLESIEEDPVLLIESASYYSDGWKARNMLFRDAVSNFHDDLSPSHNISAEAINQIGVISIHCHRFQHCNWDDPDEDDDILDVAPKLKNNAPAKALIRSGADMSTRLGKETKGNSSTINVRRLDPNDSPLAIFNIKYRSHRALQDLDIIERTPSPPPLESRPIDSLNLEEARLLLQQVKEREESSVARSAVKVESTKRERSPELPSDESRKKVKLEHANLAKIKKEAKSERKDSSQPLTVIELD